jgi:hypothetical protein
MIVTVMVIRVAIMLNIVRGMIFLKMLEEEAIIAVNIDFAETKIFLKVELLIFLIIFSPNLNEILEEIYSAMDSRLLFFVEEQGILFLTLFFLEDIKILSLILFSLVVGWVVFVGRGDQTLIRSPITIPL